jgi:plastocyanin
MKRTILLAITAGALASLLWAEVIGEHLINQKDREFSKTEITIKRGEKLRFQNDDTVTHNVFSNSKINPFNIKVQRPGQFSTVEFKDEGVTEVRCAIHPKMKLIITVKP